MEYKELTKGLKSMKNGLKYIELVTQAKCLMEEADWITDTFGDVSMPKYITRELEKRRAIIEDRAITLMKEAKNYEIIDKEDEK